MQVGMLRFYSLIFLCIQVCAYVCICVWVCICKCTAWWCQKRVSDSLEPRLQGLELLNICSRNRIWVLWRTVHAYNCRDISPAPWKSIVLWCLIFFLDEYIRSFSSSTYSRRIAQLVSNRSILCSKTCSSSSFSSLLTLNRTCLKGWSPGHWQ